MARLHCPRFERTIVMALSEKIRKVRLVIEVDGEPHTDHTFEIPAYAVDYACGAAFVQLEDPDLDSAAAEHEDEDEVGMDGSSQLEVGARATSSSFGIVDLLDALKESVKKND